MGYVRPPAVAGRFYTDDAKALASEVARLCGDTSEARPALAVMAPHAGYMYSGRVAGRTFGRVAVPGRVVVLAPNHTGRGAPISVIGEGAFRLPGGDVPIDAELARAFLAETPGAREDTRAHEAEHALEVELPFLRARRADVRIVPVVLGGLDEEEVVAVGLGLHRAVARLGLDPRRDVLVVASSDMSHYLPDDEARRVDAVALEPLLGLDARRLYRTVEERDISMCGVLPATAMLAYANAAGAERADLVAYATSADAFGDRSRVVGYAGVVVA